MIEVTVFHFVVVLWCLPIVPPLISLFQPIWNEPTNDWLPVSLGFVVIAAMATWGFLWV